jgi:hypothetical protein
VPIASTRRVFPVALSVSTQSIGVPHTGFHDDATSCACGRPQSTCLIEEGEEGAAGSDVGEQ